MYQYFVSSGPRVGVVVQTAKDHVRLATVSDKVLNLITIRGRV